MNATTFAIGDRVRILDPGHTSLFAGKVGRIERMGSDWCVVDFPPSATFDGVAGTRCHFLLSEIEVSVVDSRP